MFLAAVLSVLLTSCSLFQSPGIPVPDQYRQADSEELAALTARLDVLRDSCRSLRAQALTRIAKGIGSESFLQIIAFERPAPMRLDFFEPSGTALLAYAVMTQDSFSFLDQGKKEVILGSSSAGLFKEILGVPLEIEEVTALFCATVPEAYRPVRAFLDAEQDAYVVDLSSTSGRRMRVDARNVLDAGKDSLELRELIVRSRTGTLILRMQFSYLPSASFPKQMKLDVKKTGTTLEMDFRRAERNPQFSERARRAFLFQIPRGYEVLEFRD